MENKKPTRNSEVLASFVAYCEQHPDERFWQAANNWSGFNYIVAHDSKMEGSPMQDLFYLEGRNS